MNAIASQARDAERGRRGSADSSDTHRPRQPLESVVADSACDHQQPSKHGGAADAAASLPNSSARTRSTRHLILTSVRAPARISLAARASRSPGRLPDGLLTAAMSSLLSVVEVSLVRCWASTSQALMPACRRGSSTLSTLARSRSARSLSGSKAAAVRPAAASVRARRRSMRIDVAAVGSTLSPASHVASPAGADCFYALSGSAVVRGTAWKPAADSADQGQAWQRLLLRGRGLFGPARAPHDRRARRRLPLPARVARQADVQSLQALVATGAAVVLRGAALAPAAAGPETTARSASAASQLRPAGIDVRRVSGGKWHIDGDELDGDGVEPDGATDATTGSPSLAIRPNSAGRSARRQSRPSTPAHRHADATDPAIVVDNASTDLGAHVAHAVPASAHASAARRAASNTGAQACRSRCAQSRGLSLDDLRSRSRRRTSR